MDKKNNKESGLYAYDGLERIMHEKARIGILVSLFTNVNGYNFNRLKKLCNLTDGNLSRHIKVLKESNLIEVEKGYKNNKPITICKLTELGRKKFKCYIQELENVIKDACEKE